MPYSKAARRRLAKQTRILHRSEAARLRLPSVLGIIPAAELAIEEQDRERAKRMDMAIEPLRAIARQTPLERYLVRGEVTRTHYNDGNHLLHDWLLSGLDPQITGAYDQMMSHSGTPPVPGTGPGYSFYVSAIRAVGLILSPVLVHVVLHGLPASSWAESLHRPRSDGIAALRLGLDSLGVHYHGRARRHEN